MVHDFVIDGPFDNKIVGDFRYSNANGQLIVFCHGFKGFKDWGHFNLIADELVKNGFRVLKFNFSYNGGTPEEPIDFPDLKSFAQNTYLKEVKDLEHLLNVISQNNWSDSFLKDHFIKYPIDKLNIIGHSRGGGIATVVGANNNLVNKVIAWAGVTDFLSRLPDEDELIKWQNDGVRIVMNARTNQMMPMNYEFVQDLLDNKEKLSIPNAAKKLKKNLCWIHGAKDEAVKVVNAEDLKGIIPEMQLVVLPNAQHTFGGKHPYEEKQLPEDTKELLNATIDFLNG